MSKKRIAIISYNFYPLINPRAFRASELAWEFVRQNNEVIVFIPDNPFDYSGIEKDHPGIKICKVKSGYFKNKVASEYKQKMNAQFNNSVDKRAISNSPSVIQRLKTYLVKLFYPGGFNFEFARTCSKALIAYQGNFDLAISIGLPINSHVALTRACRNRKNLAKVKIADYGDSYSYSFSINPPKIHRLWEKNMLKIFDFVMVPNLKLLDSFQRLVPAEKIKVIPQGLDFDSIELSDSKFSKKNKIPHFAYSGVFYRDIRNPRAFLDYLCSLNTEFRFILFTDMGNPDNQEIITPYIKKLKKKMIVNGLKPRVECIYEMSKADFLINVENTTSDTVPSKLIDYALTKLPVYSFHPNEFNPEILDQFMAKDYKNDCSVSVEIENYNIKNVVAEIFRLMQTKPKH